MSQLITILQIGSVMLLLSVPAFLTKQWWMLYMFLGFGIVFGITEVSSIMRTGLSISQHFWLLKQTNPKDALIVALSLALGWAILIYHFMVHK